MRNLIVIGAAALLTGAGAFALESGPDAVIFPKQHIPVFFNHDYHVTKPVEGGAKGEGLACTFCHENISDSQSAGDRDIPGHGSCDSCHGDWIGEADKPAPRAECARCHKDLTEASTSTFAAKLSIPEPNILFPHKRHVDAGVACTDCHSKVPQKTVATRDDYPTMDRCVACHEEKGVSTACKTCHLTAKDGRLLTRFNEGVLEPRRFHTRAIHSGDFLRTHASPAKRDKAYCMQCHKESDCLSCHDGVARDVRYHPADWLSIHFLRGRKDDMRCQSCHRLQSFCLDCHVKSGVATASDVSGVITRRTIRTGPGVDGMGKQAILANGPHPMEADGWLDPASRNFHGFHAQRNIRSCAGCHQEQYCIRCHKSGPATDSTQSGGNPHGPNPQRLSQSTARKQNARMCLKCHSPFDTSWR